jgi:hypothetical protein
MQLWEFAVLSVPYVAIIFFLLRQLNIMNSSHVKERQDLINRVSSSVPRETFVPMDQIMNKPEDLFGGLRSTSIHDVEGQDQ